MKQEGLDGAQDAYIECIIYHRMWTSERRWKTAVDVKAGLKALKNKKD